MLGFDAWFGNVLLNLWVPVAACFEGKKRSKCPVRDTQQPLANDMAANYNYHHDNYEPYCLAKARLMFIFVISDAHTREFALAEAATGTSVPCMVAAMLWIWDA